MSELSLASFQTNSGNIMPRQNFHQEKTFLSETLRELGKILDKKAQTMMNFKKIITRPIFIGFFNKILNRSNSMGAQTRTQHLKRRTHYRTKHAQLKIKFYHKWFILHNFQ